MIDLKRSDRNRVAITDAISDVPVVLYYRTPTTEELVRYNQRMIKQDGDTMQVDQQARIEAVLEVLTGFDDGVFGFDGRPVSSDLMSPDYRADWKDVLRDTGAKYLLPAATVIFETLGVKALPFVRS